MFLDRFGAADFGLFAGAALRMAGDHLAPVNVLEDIGDHRRGSGTTVDFYMIAFRGGMPLGSLVSGYLATYLGAPLVIGINGALLVGVAVYFLARNHGVLDA